MAVVELSPFIMPGDTLRNTISGGFTLSAAESLLAYIIDIPKTGTLKKIGWRLNAVSSPRLTCRVSIETIAATVGQPVATTDAGKTLYATSAVSSDITDPSSGLRFDEINGSTGISVTQGNKVAVVIRIISFTSGSISPNYAQYSAPEPPIGFGFGYGKNSSYTATYNGSSWGIYYTPIILLEYDTGFVVTPMTFPANVSSKTSTFSGSGVRRGVRFKFPVGYRIMGVAWNGDMDGDFDLYLYGPDGYTVLAGPISCDADKRSANTVGGFVILFPTSITIESDTFYYLMFAPVDATSSSVYVQVLSDDGALVGNTAFQTAENWLEAYRSTAPSSGDADYTVEAARRPCVTLICDGINVSEGGGGLLVHPGMNGGLNA